MGVLYDYSLVMLVVFGIILQLGSAAMFVWLQRPPKGSPGGLNSVG
jgi:hypothetical protein